MLFVALAVGVVLLAGAVAIHWVLFFLDWRFGWFGDLGPIVAGSPRWRRMRAAYAADEPPRQALAALTADDRKWLAAMGWTGQDGQPRPR